MQTSSSHTDWFLLAFLHSFTLISSFSRLELCDCGHIISLCSISNPLVRLNKTLLIHFFQMELEALRSIYEGDESFRELSPVSFQYRVRPDMKRSTCYFVGKLFFKMLVCLFVFNLVAYIYYVFGFADAFK